LTLDLENRTFRALFPAISLDQPKASPGLESLEPPAEALNLSPEPIPKKVGDRFVEVRLLP
jgi:hypothetical protein